MKHLVFLLEEESAKEMLSNLMPRVAPEATYRFITFEGKTDLENNIVRKLRGYNLPNSYFIILRDQDSGDCHIIKNGLTEKCITAFKPNALVRIACRELESWYLADLNAVEEALKISGLQSKQNKAKFRNPDELPNPSDELIKLTKGMYQKVSGSRRIGKCIDIDNIRSNSFRVFIEGIKSIMGN